MSTGLGKLLSWARPPKKNVYYLTEGSVDEKGLLGNKGARLCEMFRLGMPVPPAFVISTDACNEYLDNKKVELQPELIQEYTKAIHELETQTEKCFGGDVKEKTPMLLSVRSSTPVSMPGMSETILNLGMNDEVFYALVSSSGNLRWACDTYRRFLQMFGVLVLGVERKHYDEILNTACRKGNFADETQLTVQDLQDIVQSFKTITAVPDDPWEQLRMAVEAIFASWYSAKGMRYRDVHNIPADIGTAVIVQSMVYGNANTRSGSGVAMTRNPTTGEKELFGEYLRNSEGEEMADGVRTPVSLSTWQKEVPDLGEKLQHIEGILEKHFCDMQDIEFTVENGELYVLETRPAKRTARAAVRIAVEMVEEGLLTEREALLRFDPNQMDYFLNPVIDPSYRNENDPKVVERTLGKGLAGSDGTIVGKAVFDMKQVETCVNNGESCILILDDVTTAHRSALKIASGLLTVRGGRDTYGAEIMRALGKPCVMGASNLRLDAEKGELSVSPEVASSTTGQINHIIHAGDSLTIDGSSGMIYTGEIPTVSVGQDAHYMKVIFWADKYKRMDVYANAESRVDVLQADRMGADGIGSLRTERMLKKGSRIDLFRRAILTEDAMSRKQCLLQLLPLLQADFLEIFTFQSHRPVCVRLLDPPLGSFLPTLFVEDGGSRKQCLLQLLPLLQADFLEIFTFQSHRPVCVRLLDPPLGSFLPTLFVEDGVDEGQYEAQLSSLAGEVGISKEACLNRIRLLREENPLLGFRGSRLSILYPEITEMLTKAVVGAAIEAKKGCVFVAPHIMIPLVVTDHEVDIITPMIRAAAESVCAAAGSSDSLDDLGVRIGSMIETPRA
eukprot:CAMPEP_0175033100 /NCGR_PEP_ID=MMETSP0005-20121125/21801_1 /TAXON_ID=420556 /ORGANISM="Ochromonas sp., Strain CCMP1393" /LENGTH=843 /DNA_ID=CAMNT_0016293659 /DNA_START=19 /DNA_END=2546 /DNA_ORIENTATION=+